jgi:L-galactose dehydrogenase
MKYRKLGKTDMNVSILSFGASPLGNVFDVSNETEGEKAVHYAIDHGINYFDVAPMYGTTLAESRLGKALKGKRNKIFLATKCSRYSEKDFDFSYDRVLLSVDESLERLQTDYVDLLQIHDIEFGTMQQILEEAIPAAIKAKEMGKARFIGITGLPVRYLAKIIRQVDVDTVLSWAHYNLLEDEINDELVPLSKEKGFGLINASPLLQRLLSESTIPDWHRSPQEVKDLQPILIRLCANFGVKLSDVAIRFALDHPDIATTIVGMSKLKNVEQNIRVLDFKTPDGLMEKIENSVKTLKNKMWFEGNPENNISKNKPTNESILFD